MALSSTQSLRPAATTRMVSYQAMSLLALPAAALHSVIDRAVADNPFLEFVPRDDVPIDDVAAYLPASSEDPRQALSRQIDQDFPLPQDRAIAMAYLEALDDRGYCPVTPADIARLVGSDMSRAEHIRRHLQAYEPAGIFAFDLEDCLRLQLVRQGAWDDGYVILLNHLPLVARAALSRLAALGGMTEAEIADRIAVIKRLDPTPLDHVPSQVGISPAIPDLIMTRSSSGRIEVALNPLAWPRLRLSGSVTRPSSPRYTADAKKFTQEQRRQAKLFLGALDRRDQTILRVGRVLADHQAAFLDQGPAALQPLTRRGLAKILDLHETTIGRAVADKYALTPRGVVPLSAFFSRSLRLVQATTSSPAAAAARGRLAILLGQPETSSATDATLAKILQQEGFSIARRTVANYRKSLKMLPGSPRGRAIALRRATRQTKFKE